MIKNITLFKGTKEKGFTRFQIYTHTYLKKTIEYWKEIKTEISTLMIDFTYTPESKEARNWKIVGNYKSDKAYTIRIGFSTNDLEDLANLLAFLKDEREYFSTVHTSNVDNKNKSLIGGTIEIDKKIFIPWQKQNIIKEKIKTLNISYEGKKISFTLSLPEAKLIATWIEKYFI